MRERDVVGAPGHIHDSHQPGALARMAADRDWRATAAAATGREHVLLVVFVVPAAAQAAGLAGPKRLGEPLRGPERSTFVPGLESLPRGAAYRVQAGAVPLFATARAPPSPARPALREPPRLPQ